MRKQPDLAYLIYYPQPTLEFTWQIRKHSVLLLCFIEAAITKFRNKFLHGFIKPFNIY